MDDRARLLDIDAMTSTYAQALLDAGLNTYWEIYRLKAATLVENASAALAAMGSSDPVDVELAVRWQKSAVRLSLTRHVTVSVRSDRLRQPLSGATVVAGDVEGITDKAGGVELAGVRTDVTHITVSCPGYYDFSTTVDFRADRPHRFGINLSQSRSGGRHPVYLSEYDGYLLESRPGDTQRSRTRQLEEIPAGALLLCGHKDAESDSVQLVSLMRVRDGNTIYSDRVHVPSGSLPSGAVAGQVLLWSGGTLQASGKTRADLAAQWQQQKFALPAGVTLPRVIIDEHVDRISGPVALPPVDWEALTPDQQRLLRSAFADQPDGVPVSQIRAILENR